MARFLVGNWRRRLWPDEKLLTLKGNARISFPSGSCKDASFVIPLDYPPWPWIPWPTTARTGGIQGLS